MGKLRSRENEIYNEFYNTAIFTARKYLKNECDTEHAAVLALTKVIEKYKNHSPSELDKSRPYIFTMIKNTCISELRKLNTQRKYFLLHDDFYAFSITYIDTDKEQEMDELILKVDKELETLSTMEKSIIQMKFFEKKSYKEMALLLDVTSTSMGTRYVRALNKLRNRLTA